MQIICYMGGFDIFFACSAIVCYFAVERAASAFFHFAPLKERFSMQKLPVTRVVLKKFACGAIR